MYERFDAEAIRVHILAGELAAQRRYERGTHFTTDVRITCADLRLALKLLHPGRSWSGGTTPALARRLRSIDGPIGVEQLRRALSQPTSPSPEEER